MNDLAADTVAPESVTPSAPNPAVETPAVADQAPDSKPSLISSEAPAETAPSAETPSAPELVTLEALKLPEGVTIDQDALSTFLETVNTDGLSRAEMAQKFIDLQLSLNEKAGVAAVTAAQELWDTTQAEWISQCRALPEIGGDRLPTTLADIKRGLASAGASSEFFRALDLTGAGSHPAIVQVMHKLVQPFLEKAPVSGEPPRGTLSAALKLYPTMAPKE